MYCLRLKPKVIRYHDQKKSNQYTQGWAEVFRQNVKHHHQELVIEDILLNNKFCINIK